MNISLAIVPFLLIPYDSLTNLLGFDPNQTAETLPLTAIFSILYLLIRRGRIQSTRNSTHVFVYLVAATTWIVLVTTCNILAEASGTIRIDDNMRVQTAFRQGISLGAGLCTYLMFEDALLRIGWRTAFRWITIGALPSLVFCGIQLLRGSSRLQGFSSEPSQLADMLVFAFFPACAYANLKSSSRIILMALGAAALLLSFSGTGLMKAAFALLCLSAVHGRLIRGAFLVTCLLILTYQILLFFPDNYIFGLWNLFQSFLDSGTLIGGSFIDRFFGFVSPLETLRELHGWFGFGLGGDTVYFDYIFNPDTAEAIRQVKGAIASISSLQAKVLLYGGLLGYSLYFTAWWSAWRTTSKLHPARFMLPAIFAASVFSLAPFFLPYVWLWLAIATTTQVRRTYSVLPSMAEIPRDVLPGHRIV